MSKPGFSHIRVLFVNTTLKPSPKQSHTNGLMQVSKNILDNENVQHETIRIADFEDLATGIHPDMTEHSATRDVWPELFEKIMSADVLIVGSPIWLGQLSSYCMKFIERMYAMSGKTNDKGQYIFYGKTAGCIITGNEDGVKHCSMSLLYSLMHIGYTIPPQADAGWIGEVGPGPSYLDEESNAKENDFTNRNTTFMTYNLLHMAKMLKHNAGIPNYGNSKEAWSSGQKWGFANPEYR